MFFSAALAIGADAPDAVKNPYAGNPAAIAAGRDLYAQACQACHGGEARGDRGPALATGNFRHGGEDTDLFQTIRGGIPGSQMPAFSTLPTDNIWRIITYLRSLNTQSAAANEVVAGDAGAGEKTFWGKGGCASCHEVNGRGAAVGPDLSAAGTNSADYLHSVIANPNDPALRRRSWAGPAVATVKTKDGKQIRGLIRSQDSYNLLLIDTSGTLHHLQKRELLDFQPETTSLMPAYAARLSADEIQNTVAYLKTLQARDLTKTIQVEIPGGLTFERLSHAEKEPQNWLTYWGNYQGQHFTALKQITPANVAQLQARWSTQMPGSAVLEATPLVVDGTMYAAGPPGEMFAIDARTGLRIWKYERRQKVVNPYQINPFNRGAAVLGNRVFFGTLDAALVALDARTGRLLWETQVADTLQGYSLTGAPLAIKDKIIVGVAGGEFGIRGFIDAYDAATGKRLWRFQTVPGPGEYGNETWPGDTWKRGSGGAWLTGSYDPVADVLYWAVGNPGPNLNGDIRKGDNLFTCSVVALDPATGKRKWHYQFTPNDTHDWDANEDLVLANRVVAGKQQAVVMQADRNGMFYVLDRSNGKFISATAYVRQTWNLGFDKEGHPLLAPNWRATPQGNALFPSLIGGTNWQSPSYDADRGMLYLAARDTGMGYRSGAVTYEAGRQYQGGSGYPVEGTSRNGIMAIDTSTGEKKWTFPLEQMSASAGVLATGSGILFAATQEGNLIALDAATGKSLWHFQTGAAIASSPISYAVDGKQFIAIAAGNVLYTFALPELNGLPKLNFRQPKQNRSSKLNSRQPNKLDLPNQTFDNPTNLIFQIKLFATPTKLSSRPEAQP